MKRLFLRMAPEWWVVIILAIVTFTMSQIIHAPFQFPTFNTFLFMGLFYLSPFILIGVWISLPFPFLIYRGKFKKAALRTLQQMNYVVCLCIVLLLAFHIKLWAPLLNPLTYDPLYEAIDRHFFFWVDPLISWRSHLHSDWFDRLYFNLVTTMFICSFIVHYLRGHAEFRRVFLASILLQAVGGISYVIAPALGPFLYHAGANAYSASLEDIFMSVHRAIVAGGIGWLQDNTSVYLVSGLGAMPSLHIAIAFVFLYYARKYCKWLAWFYWPSFIWIAFEAMATRWHYGIDLIVGVILSYGCVLLADLWASAHEAALELKPELMAELAPIIEPGNLEESS